MTLPFVNAAINQTSSGSDTNNASEGKTKNTKRKTNAAEKIYLCAQCDKKYTNSASLYTHIKAKHTVIDPNVKPVARGRGRPKMHKSPPASETSSTSAPIQKERDVTNEPIQVVEPSPSCECSLPNMFNKQPSDLNFLEEDTKGSTQDHLLVFEEVLESLYQKNTHPLKVAMEKLNHKESIIDKTCDIVLGEYLIEMSKMVKKDFYKAIARFVLLYRDCFNSLYKDRSENEGADRLPCRCNEFLDKYAAKSKLSNRMIIQLTLHMCNWLLEHSYTWVKLSLIA